jgi:hypothetical protein
MDIYIACAKKYKSDAAVEIPVCTWIMNMHVCVCVCVCVCVRECALREFFCVSIGYISKSGISESGRS